MSAFRPTLMIRTAAAEQTPVHPALLAILGQPMDYSDPENPVEVTPLHVADYFKNYRDQLAPVESTMHIRIAGDVVTMFPEGYPEEYMFPTIMADRIPGATRKEQQDNRNMLKEVFAGMTSAHGANGLVRYLSTAPEKQDYINVVIEEVGI